VSSQAFWALASVSTGALLLSPFNVKWECYVWAGGVEESKFCLFSVVFPVRFFSSISPRFYFRKHAFCFLPLAAILANFHQDNLDIKLDMVTVLEEETKVFYVYMNQNEDCNRNC
jgi:hypothetical protein